MPNVSPVELLACRWVTTADICWVYMYMLDTQYICVGFSKYMLGSNFMYVLGMYVGHMVHI